MGRNLDLHGLETIQRTVGTGMSAFVTINGEGKLINNTFKYVSGGTMYVLGASQQAAAVADGLTLTGYLVGTSEVLSFIGPATYYIYALGATVISHGFKGFSQGF